MARLRHLSKAERERNWHVAVIALVLIFAIVALSGCAAWVGGRA